MRTDKKGFISYLKGLHKRDRAPELKELIGELKKRRLNFYTRPDGKKSIVLVHPRKNKSPKPELPDYFTEGTDEDDSLYEILLLWVEELGMNPEDTTDILHDFLTDGDEREDEGLPYIQ